VSLLAVNFHYYGNEKYSGGIYPINQKTFSRQLDVLSQSYDFISQRELSYVSRRSKVPEGKRCQITFDDGLKQQMKAFHLLENKGIPAVFYVPTQPIFEKKALFVHKLHLIRTRYNDLDLLTQIKAFSSIRLDEKERIQAASQYKYDNDNAREVKYLLNFKMTDDLRQNFVHDLFIQIVGNESNWCDSFYMNRSDLKELADAGSLGSHGHSHFPLAQMNDFPKDIATSVDHINDFVNNLDEVSFSYPYGSPSAVNERVAKVVRKAGFSYAYTMWRGINTGVEPFNPFLLQRLDTNDAPSGKNPNPNYLK